MRDHFFWKKSTFGLLCTNVLQKRGHSNIAKGTSINDVSRFWHFWTWSLVDFKRDIKRIVKGRKYGPLDFKSTLRFIFLIILTDNGTLSPSTTSTSNGQSLSSAFKIVPQKTDLPSSTTGKILDLNKSIKWDENVDCKPISCNENRISLCALSHRGNSCFHYRIPLLAPSSALSWV